MGLRSLYTFYGMWSLAVMLDLRYHLMLNIQSNGFLHGVGSAAVLIILRYAMIMSC
jgi:hypothetical protein